MHPRACVSAICTYRLSLVEDIEFWARHGINRVGVSVAKLDAHGWDDGCARVHAAIDRGLQIVNLIGLGPFELAHPERWAAQRARLVRAVDAAHAFGAECLVLTTGPATPLTWEEAADALEEAFAPALAEAHTRGVALAVEHTHSLRVDVGFVHRLADALDLARRLGTDVCMEINACWAERDLEQTVSGGIDRIRLVQVSDFRVGTHATPDRVVPGDGDIPLARIVQHLLACGYRGSFDLEVIGPRIEDEGYDGAIPRAVAALDRLLIDAPA
ncbi:MAG: sugar phosphate isomerase/epimerase family protein [Acidimicrobiia bacterium]